jgi:plasmid maintenance system killer protein
MVYTSQDMWTVEETKAASKAIERLPPNVGERYRFWRTIVETSGPQGLRAIKGFHDEKLAGKLKHLRSSRLSLQWRVIYSVAGDIVTVTVESVTPHEYKP